METQENPQTRTPSEPTYRELSVSIIAPGCSIEGNAVAEKGISILGLVTGDVYSRSGLLHIGDDGRVIGDIDGMDVLIDGKVEGTVRARGTLSINGRVRGDIRYATIRLGEDADLDGCRIQRIRPDDGQPVDNPLLHSALGARESNPPPVKGENPSHSDDANVTQLPRMAVAG
jgi:cytoskeletal protein CcmA (bactofilin family)